MNATAGGLSFLSRPVLNAPRTLLGSAVNMIALVRFVIAGAVV